MKILSGFICGLIFGLGLVLSGMTDPVKVQGFLDVTGQWDMTLAFVMMGAIGVSMPTFIWLRRRAQPVFAPSFQWPQATQIDWRLLLGAALFGVGWGLSGLCPGPALVSVVQGGQEIVMFVVSLLLGSWLHDRFFSATKSRLLLMIFRQLFDKASSTYTYLLACEQTREAILIDPVKEQLAQYLQLLRELDLTLLYAADTHTHADHITALGALRDATGCVTLMGEFTQAGCVSRGLKDGEIFKVGALSIQALYTPGHTDESFSFVLNPTQPEAVFTGDTLLIRGTGRTDFQGGSGGR